MSPDRIEHSHLTWAERTFAIQGTLLTYAGLETGYQIITDPVHANPNQLIFQFIDNPHIVVGGYLTLGLLSLLVSIPYRGSR